MAAVNRSAEGEFHRGFRNLAGQNNCFLNSALQTLWHLPKFREALQSFGPSEHGAHFKGLQLLPPLQSLFANYQYGEDSVLPADDVRAVLGALYAGQGKFQLGEIDDAVECLEAILLHVHCESVGCSDASEGSDKVCNPTCPACSVFKVEYFDQAKCSKCDATTDPVVCGDFLYRIWVSELLEGSKGETFAQCLKRAWHQEAIEKAQASLSLTQGRDQGKEGGGMKMAQPPPPPPPPCPGYVNGAACAKGTRIEERWCVQLPSVFTTNLVWATDNPSARDIKRLLSTLRCAVNLEQVFTIPDDGSSSSSRSRSNSSKSAVERERVRLVVPSPLPPVGTQARVPLPDGRVARVQIPAGKQPGDFFSVKVPKLKAQDAQLGPKHMYRFCGMICYYGKHYVSLFARRMTKKKKAAARARRDGRNRIRGGNHHSHASTSTATSNDDAKDEEEEEEEEGHGEWLCFDDEHIRVLASWKEAKRFCAKAKYQPTVVWFEKVPEGEAPWWDDDDNEDDDDDEDEDDDHIEAKDGDITDGKVVLRLNNGAAPLNLTPSTCSEATHLAAVAAAEAELAALDFSSDGTGNAIAPGSSGSISSGHVPSGDLPSGAAAAATAMQQQVGQMGAYAASSLREGALLAQEGLRETLGTPLVGDPSRPSPNPSKPAPPPPSNGREQNGVSYSDPTNTNMTPLARAKLRAQYQQQQQEEEEQKDQAQPPRVKVAVKVKPSEDENGGVGGASGAALRHSLGSGAGAGYGGTVRRAPVAAKVTPPSHAGSTGIVASTSTRNHVMTSSSSTSPPSESVVPSVSPPVSPSLPPPYEESSRSIQASSSTATAAPPSRRSTAAGIFGGVGEFLRPWRSSIRQRHNRGLGGDEFMSSPTSPSAEHTSTASSMLFPTIDPSSPGSEGGGEEIMNLDIDAQHHPHQNHGDHSRHAQHEMTPELKVPMAWERDVEEATLKGDFKAIQERMATLTRTRELEEAGAERRKRSSQLANGVSNRDEVNDSSLGFFRYQAEVSYPRSSASSEFEGSGLQLGGNNEASTDFDLDDDDITTDYSSSGDLRVVGYARGPNGTILPPEQKGDPAVGDCVLSVNAVPLRGLGVARAMHLVEACARHAHFHNHPVIFELEAGGQP